MYDAEGTVTSVRSVHVYWKQVVASLIVAWCLGMPIGRWITGYEKRNGEFVGPLRTGWTQPAAIVGYVIAGCVIPAIIGGYVASRYESFSDSIEWMFGMFIVLRRT